jgi:sugar/nucleoside kinase (ribokinase family)
MQTERIYDLVIIGNYTKDTIISPAGTRYVDGGGFNYGAHVAAMMGLKAAAVTRLAREDQRVVDALVRIGIDVYPFYTPHSTEMRLFYPTADVDNRVLSVAHTAGSFVPDQVAPLEARAFLINSSIRGEVGLDVIRALRAKDTLLAADVQGFTRIVGPEGVLQYGEWPQKQEVLSHIGILKTDAVEAEILTGNRNLRDAAAQISAWGPREVVLTHRDGLLVLAEGNYYEAPFRPKEMVGRSGRGDTCIGSYLAKRLAATAQEATVWAAAVTSLKMEAEGPIRRTPAEVEQLIERLYMSQVQAAD